MSFMKLKKWVIAQGVPKAVRQKTPVAQVVPSKPKAAAKPAERRKVFQAEVVELLDSSDDEDGGPRVEVNVSTTHDGNKTIEVTVTTTYHDDGRVQEHTSTKTTTRVQKAPEQSAAKPVGRAQSSPSHDLHDMSYMALKKWMKAQGISREELDAQFGKDALLRLAKEKGLC